MGEREEPSTPRAEWSPSSWRARPIAQQPRYDDPAALERALGTVRALPPLVFSGEVEHLKTQLAEAAAGRAFVLHGGDCAERFRDCQRDTIVKKLKILLQMSLVITHATRRPVVRIGRLAGQYAKPRSSDREVVDGVELPVYRGDLINDLEATPAARRADPDRLPLAYFHAATTLNFVRALVDGGFADLRHPDHWSLEFMGSSPERRLYEEIADRIRDAIDFFDSLGGLRSGFLERVDFYTSHEGLLLPFEEAMTSRPPRRGRHYNLGAHHLWIGDRTRQLDGAHVEYFRGIANPIGVKIGPSMANDELVALADRLDPEREPGRLTLITRYGAEKIAERLPRHLSAMRSAGHTPLWSADPMHGNGIKTARGYKTRSFDAILSELRQAFAIHGEAGSHLGGVHFELTGDLVTECIGGAQGLGEDDLAARYDTGCDPRLNYAQSLEMAFLLADLVRPTRRPRGRTGSALG